MLDAAQQELELSLSIDGGHDCDLVAAKLSVLWQTTDVSRTIAVRKIGLEERE
jgi:hypothetical protein